MQFLRSVRIEDFRSIAAARIDGLQDITPVVGLNGSGKSNLMRALNLFFTGQVERQSGLELRRDFREPGRKAKLRVAVEADLDFGIFSGLRREYEFALDQLSGGSRQITVRKEWTLDPGLAVQAGVTGSQLDSVAPDRMVLVDRLIGAVRFRYLANHIHPSRILEDEENEIRRMLFDRLRKRQILQEQTVGSIADVASELMQPIVNVMKGATGDVGNVELATPADWRELAWAFGMKLRGLQSQSFDALVHGSGVQSILAYSILHAVDTSFSGSFGWRKGAIWAVEEPESFLHVGLQEELARLLMSYSRSDPLQVILTTHATPFLGVGDRGLVTTVDGLGRTEFAGAEKTDLLRAAFTSRIAPYAHALHIGPPKPVLLVEGKTDRDLLIRAYLQAGIVNPYQILSLENLSEGLQGGDEVAQWLKYNAAALSARADESPVFVLRDWESRPRAINQIQDALRVHATSRCFAWPRDLTNQDLSERFVGIEKLLSTDFIEHAAAVLGLQLLTPAAPNRPTWRYDVDRSAFQGLKPHVHQELAARNNGDDIQPLINALPWLSNQLAALPPLL